MAAAAALQHPTRRETFLAVTNHQAMNPRFLPSFETTKALSPKNTVGTTTSPRSRLRALTNITTVFHPHVPWIS